MMHILYDGALVSFPDAVTTYTIITTSRGVEANPFMQFLNGVPEAVFLIQIFSVLMLASLFKIFEILNAAVVVNNVLGTVVGITTLADALYA